MKGNAVLMNGFIWSKSRKDFSHLQLSHILAWVFVLNVKPIDSFVTHYPLVDKLHYFSFLHWRLWILNNGKLFITRKCLPEECFTAVKWEVGYDTLRSLKSAITFSKWGLWFWSGGDLHWPLHNLMDHIAIASVQNACKRAQGRINRTSSYY